MKRKRRKSVMKRFKLTKTGKLKFRPQMGRHRRRTKTKSQQRKSKVMQTMMGRTKTRIKKMM